MQRSNPHRDAGRHLEERAAFLLPPLLALGLTLVIELFNHTAFTDGPASFWAFAAGAPAALLVNYLLVLITLVPALFLRRRIFWYALVSFVWLLAGAVNGFILLNRMTPFTVADLTVFRTGIDTLPIYLPIPYIVLLAAALAGILAGLALLFWRGRRSAAPRRVRALSGAAALAVCAALLAGGWQLAFQVKQLSTVFSNLAFAYEDYGFAYCFLQTWLNQGVRPPSRYGAQEISGIREAIEIHIQEETADLRPQADVNVLFVQLESFIDPAQIQGLSCSADPVPTWTALRELFSTGYLTVPVVGGGTANTECEVLTGMSTRLFGPGEYPYQTCLKRQAVETAAYNLKANGYAAHAIHNYRATFYGRSEVYANLGFDDFTSLEYMPQTQQTPTNWAKDGVLTGQILRALDATPDQADLVFTVSVQGHGKYPAEPVLSNPPITVTLCPESLSREAVEYYVNQVHEMDRFLKELITALSQREERTLLVLYGDHLPALELDNQDMASGSLYKTEYIIWDNFGLCKADDDLAAYQLSAAALARIGVSTGYFNAFHQFCQGDPAYAAELWQIQYDVLYGRKYLYGGTSPYAPTDMWMGMEPITVDAILRLGERTQTWFLLGKNFSPYCQVTRDGGRLEAEYVAPWLMVLTEDPETADPSALRIQVVDPHNEILSGAE